MKIPTETGKRMNFYEEVLAQCLFSRERRMEQYAMNRRYYLYGAGEEGRASPWNKVYSHIDLVASMLYASDGTRFVTRLESGAPTSDYKKTHAFTKRTKEAWDDSNTDSMFEQAVRWSLVYDTMIVKFIRTLEGEMSPYLVDPGSFGVYREDVTMLDRQEAFVQVYYMTLSEFSRRLSLHPKRDAIVREIEAAQSQRDVSTEMPAILDRILVYNNYPLTTGNNMIGEANLALSGILPDYKAAVGVPLIEMKELWLWNDAIDDYQTVTLAGENHIVYDRQNIFMPRTKEFAGEHGFVQVCPSPQYDYFWGISEVGRLVLLQERRNKRMDDIQIQLEKAIFPPVAVMGTGALEDKLAQLQEPRGAVMLGDPSTKVEQFGVTIPEDAYKDIKELDAMFDEASGLTNITQGKGEAGVRSAGQTSRLANLGSTRPKKRALVIEDCLEKAATLMGRHVYIDDDEPLTDDDGHPFLPAQMTPKFRIGIDAHSNSPIFAESQKQDAAVLLKAKALTRKRFIEMMAPPMMEEIIRDLQEEIIPEEKAAAQQKVELEKAKFEKNKPQEPGPAQQKGQIAALK